MAAIGIAALGAIAYTQLPKGGPDAMSGMNTVSAHAPASTQAYETVMAGMMKSMMTPLTGKADLDFMQNMIPHHQGAIDMSKAVLQYGKDAEVKSLAENVIKAQESEIAMLKAWLEKTDQNTLAVTPDSMKGNEQAMATMAKNTMVPYAGDADVDYVKNMIPHHQGAIDMAKVALQFAKDPEVLNLAQDVVTAQESEIVFMTGWLAKNEK